LFAIKHCRLGLGQVRNTKPTNVLKGEKIMYKAFCDCCNKTVNVIEDFEPMDIKTINGEVISIIGRTGACSICNMDVVVPEFDVLNLEQAMYVLENSKKYEGESSI
jgi:hypothetical protein